MLGNKFKMFFTLNLLRRLRYCLERVETWDSNSRFCATKASFYKRIIIIIIVEFHKENVHTENLLVFLLELNLL